MYRAKHTALATSLAWPIIKSLYNPWKSPYNLAVHNSIQKLWCLCLKILYPQTNSHQNRGRITNHQLPGFSPNFSEPLDSPNTHQSIYFSPYIFLFLPSHFSGFRPNSQQKTQTSVSHPDPILSWLQRRYPGNGPRTAAWIWRNAANSWSKSSWTPLAAWCARCFGRWMRRSGHGQVGKRSENPWENRGDWWNDIWIFGDHL